MLGVVAHVRERHLVRAERAFDRHAIDLAGASPALSACGEQQPAIARPSGVRRNALRPAGCGSRRMNDRVRPRTTGAQRLARPLRRKSDRIRSPRAAAGRRRPRIGRAQSVPQFCTVQVEDREHRAVARRVQVADAFPGSRKRARFGFTVADDGGDDQVRVVERRTERMREHVAELAPFMDRTRRRHADVARHAARRREAPEQAAESGGISRDFAIHLSVRALQVHVGQHCRAAVSGPCEKDGVHVMLFDQPIEMHVNEVQSWRRAPVPEEAWFDVFRPSGSVRSALSCRYICPTVR